MISGIRHFFHAIIFMAAIPFATFAQGNSEKVVAPHNWHELDKTETGYYGISLDKAYQFLNRFH